ncbi:MAG: tetratricopeptide repeat protein [Candidatus Tectimicrobiota bacterium]
MKQGTRRPDGLLWLCWFGLLMQCILGCASTARVQVQAEDHYRLAQSYLGNASYSQAEQEIRKSLGLRPDDPRYLECLALIHQAQVYQPQGGINRTRLQLAEEAYRAALRQSGAQPSVWVNYSTILLLSGRPDEAIAMAQRVLQVPGYDQPARAYTNIGIAYLHKGGLPQAAEHFQKAIEYQANLPEAHHNLGVTYTGLGRRADALRAFREAIRFRPSYIEAHLGLGKLLLEEGRKDEARLAFERIIALAPSSDLATDLRQQLKSLTP